MKYQFKTTINCGNCLKTVTPFLNEVDEVDEWHVDLEHNDRILNVEMEESKPELVVKAVKQAGFEIQSI